MIPLQLTIEGLYSYQQRHVIDFEQLTSAGIFGIFGAVGSGKSSILEAISFVLYGETERMHSRENRTYNMMNLKSNRSYIELDFINHQNKKYRATREFKRNSRNFEEVRTPTVVVYQWTDDKWLPLEHSNLHEIIGLSYANFKRTTIIPQGQFKEFLDLGATERTKMMMEIFDLQRFDLHRKTANLSEQNRSKLDQLDGQLKGFEQVSEEEIAAKQNEHSDLEKVRADAEKLNAEAQLKFQQYKNLKTDFDLLGSKTKQLEQLSEQTEIMNELDRTTEKFDRYSQLFGPLLLQQKKLRAEFDLKSKELAERTKTFAETTKSLEDIRETLSNILPAYNRLDADRCKASDFSVLLQIKEADKELSKLEERLGNGAKILKEKDDSKKTLDGSIRTLTSQLQYLRSKRIDQSLLSNVSAWFSALNNLQENKKQAEQMLKNYSSALDKILAEIATLDLYLTSAEPYEQKVKTLQRSKKSLVDEKTALEVQQKLAHYADALHDGAACPLCGALEHPNVVEFENVSTQIANINAKIEKLQLEESTIQRQFMEAEKLRERKRLTEKQLEEARSNANHYLEKIADHRTLFVWPEFDPNNEKDFVEKRSAAFTLDKNIQGLEVRIAEEQKLFEEACRQSDKFAEKLTELKLDQSRKTATVAAHKTQLQKLSYDAYEKVDGETIQQQIEALNKAISETEKQYTRLTAEEKELGLKVAKMETEVDTLKKRIDEIEFQSEQNNSGLNEALIRSNVADIRTVLDILEQPLDVAKNRAKVHEFRVAHATLTGGVSELREKLKNYTFDDLQFEAVTEEARHSEVNFRRANDAVVAARTEIRRLREEFRKKEELLREYAALSKRDENLRLMLNLFKGAGFVQYAASIYLRQLCDHANVRFHRMTRNQLSLQLNDNNEFEIIDFLNEGKRRSVKTLSGGQAFQVSLSLALALAESVSANLKAQQNFFFIDEGFGTQDPESVHVIFETLTALQKENRIVGIISHVEELKEKMPVALHITKHPERGSEIEVH